MDQIQKLMTEQLRDAYSAEKQSLRAMPRLMKKAQAQSLRDALQRHVEQTEAQVERLEQAMDRLGARPGRKSCEGMRGLIEEAQGELEDHDKGPVLDVVIAAAQQRIEHYEIAAYGSMVALARAAGEPDLAALLEQTLHEEKETDAKLAELAEQDLHLAMVEEARGGEEEEDAPEAANENRRGGRRRKAS